MAEPVELEGKRVLVVGLARTGVATARFCAERGAVVVAVDSRSETEIGVAVSEVRAAGIQLRFGQNLENAVEGQQLVVPSPGVPADAEILQAARSKDIPIWSEIELAS